MAQLQRGYGRRLSSLSLENLARGGAFVFAPALLLGPALESVVMGLLVTAESPESSRSCLRNVMALGVIDLLALSCIGSERNVLDGNKFWSVRDFGNVFDLSQKRLRTFPCYELLTRFIAVRPELVHTHMELPLLWQR